MELSQEKKDKLMSFVELLHKYKSLEIPKNATTIKVNGDRMDSKAIDKLIVELSRNQDFKEYHSFLYEFETSNIFLDYLKRAVKQHLINRASQDRKDALKGGEGFLSFDFTDLIPFVSVDRDNQITFVHAVTREIVPASFKNYEKFIPRGLQKDPIFGVIRFDPYNPEKLRKTMHLNQSVNHINTYQTPSWQFPRKLTTPEIKEYAKLPTIIDKFFNTLFPSVESREFVYDWLHFAITKRCETYLVLNGAKGIGKGLFNEHLCAKLMGEKNHMIAQPSALDSNFNAMLVDRRMIVLDEMPINDQDKIAKLKRYINQNQGIEFKGVDVGETVITYNSFVISSNNLRDMLIEWDDRRFSVMDLTEEKLSESWSVEEIEDLISAMADEGVMRNFGYWLMYRAPKGNEFAVFKGNHFWKLCYVSLPEWSKCMVDEISSGMYDTIDDETLKMKYRERGSKFPFPQNAKVEDFIKSYRHMGKSSLGTFEKTENNGFIITVSDALYKGRDSSGYDWQELV